MSPSTNLKSLFRQRFRQCFLILLPVAVASCNEKRDSNDDMKKELEALNLVRGNVALCGPENKQFGSVSFELSCSGKVKDNFNLATALLHSFEYPEAEKIFAKVIDEEPACVMAYWGAAMSLFHPLWEQPSDSELQKGHRIITLARKLIEDTTSKESNYIEGIATIYDDWNKLDHRTRLQKFEIASQNIFEKYPQDPEAAIFYSLALRASADPADKSFYKQKKAGEILNAMFLNVPDHPGVAHYIIHNFDYPELAELALPAARKYASIAAASAHAQHMPSHIFTRLGLWDESIQSNISSVASAKCYAENLGISGHSDEELHGMDYLFYAYLQKGDNRKAREQLEYLKTIKSVLPLSFKVLYSFAAIPSRYALERKDWAGATQLELTPAELPWEKFQWEQANLSFAKALGAARSNKIAMAKKDLNQLRLIYEKLSGADQQYKANLVMIQIMISEAWINLAEGKKEKAIILMREASDKEDATEKHPVTPGEIIPARELLADMYMETGDTEKALISYEADLKRHANRFNGLYGAALAAEKSGDISKAKQYYNKLIAIASPDSDRYELKLARSFVKGNNLTNN